MQGNYSVQIEGFAERHFIQSFERKYKDKWSFTLRAISSALARIDNLLLTSKAETICDVGGIRIVKTKFKIAGTNESAKTSGHRCIVAWIPDKQSVSILLIYAKTDIGSKNETSRWQKLIKENYQQYRHLF